MTGDWLMTPDRRLMTTKYRLHSQRAADESRTGEIRRKRVCGRRDAVNFFDQHSTWRLDAAASAIDEGLGYRPCDFRAIGFSIGNPGDKLSIAARQVSGYSAVYQDDRCADAACWQSSCAFGRHNRSRPFQRRTIEIGRVGRREHRDFEFV